MGTLKSCDQIIPIVDFGKGKKKKNLTSEENEWSFTKYVVNDHHEVGKGKNGSPWKLMKWTNKMVRLLIIIVYYIGEDGIFDCENEERWKLAILQK